MKRAIRSLILMVGLTIAFVTVASPLLSADGGPIPLCNPAQGCGGR
jgi:hypothetical protein